MSLPTPQLSLISAFEQAANDVQVAVTRPAAEHTLASLASRPDSIPLAFHLLRSTHSSVARFHAAATLRSASAHRWHSLPPDLRFGPASLRHRLIDLVISNPQFLPFERVAILRTAAFLTCRAYLDESPHLRDTYFSLLSDTASSPQSPPHSALTTIELVTLILEEFISPTTTPHSNSIDHELISRARSVFASPQGHIIPLFLAALHLLRSLTSTIPPQSYHTPDFSARAVPALSAIHRILTTDFENIPIHPPPDAQSDSSAPTDALETVVINTFNSPPWQPLVQHIPHLLTQTLAISSVLVSSPSAASHNDLLTNPLHIVTAIASISRATYSTPQSARELLTAILTGIHEQKWLISPHAPARLEYAEVWRRVCCAHGLTYVEQLQANYIAMFATHTCAQMDATALAALNPDDQDDDIYSMDVIDLLLETWANLALQADDGSALVNHPLSSNIEQVVIHFIRMSLRTTGAAAAALAASGSEATPDLDEDLGFEDSSIDDSRLSVAAILTRFVLDKTVEPLVQSLLQSCDKIMAWPPGQAAVNGLPLDVHQEDLYFLIRLTCAVLTDEAKGEYPSVPTQFLPPAVQDHVANGHSKTPIHAQRLILAVLDVADKETRLLSERSPHCNEASPRVGSAILDGLARIMRTYLAPLNLSQVPSTLDIAGGPGVVDRGKNACFNKAMEGIMQRGFDTDVAEAAGHLLTTIAVASKTYTELREASVWDMLLQGGIGVFQTLPPPAVQNVGRSMTQVFGDIVADRLVVPAYTSLEALSRSRGEMADAAERTIATLNLLRGSARCDAIGDRTRRALLQCLKAPEGIAAQCVKSFGATRPDVSRTLLQLADDIVYTAMSLLEGHDGRELLSNVVVLIRTHVDIVKSGDGDSGVDVEEMLILLTHVLDEEVEVDAGEACFYGLSTLLPLMNESMLDIPSVNQVFFRFVAQLVSSHAEKLSMLPADFCSKILRSIDMQRASYDAGSERKALEAITAVARARIYEEKPGRRGKNGVGGVGDQGPIAEMGRSGDGHKVVDQALREFLMGIFEAIAKGSAHMANLDAAADALLPLVHVQYDDENGRTVSAFEQVGQALVTSSGNNADLRGLLVQLGQVASEAGAAYGFRPREDTDSGSWGREGQDRAAVVQATRRFREAVVHFSHEARNCLVSIAIGSAGMPTS